jgi:hypothetical protein
MTIPQLRKELKRRIAYLDKLMFEAWKEQKDVPCIAAKQLAYKNALRLTYQK